MIEFIVLAVMVVALFLALEPAHRRARQLPLRGSDRARVRSELRAVRQHLTQGLSLR